MATGAQPGVGTPSLASGVPICLSLSQGASYVVDIWQALLWGGCPPKGTGVESRSGKAPVIAKTSGNC